MKRTLIAIPILIGLALLSPAVPQINRRAAAALPLEENLDCPIAKYAGFALACDSVGNEDFHWAS